MTKHANKNSKKKKATVPKANKKATIYKSLRTRVWNDHFGITTGEALCWVGCGNKISQLNFECGHIIAEVKGGATIPSNLHPICGPCNRSMGTKNMDEFMKQNGLGWQPNVIYGGQQPREVVCELQQFPPSESHHVQDCGCTVL